MTRTTVRAAIVVIATISSAAAQAHTGHDAAAGFGAGFTHPFGGLDHLLAMIAVGILAARLGGRALWALPAAFVSAMAAGALIARVGGDFPHVEAAIALSVVAFGVMLAIDRRPSTIVALLVAAGFAIFHGHAHGAEAPEAGSFLGYGAGFVLATTTLHGLGIALGLAAGRLMGSAPTAQRIGGAAIAATGLMLLFA